MGKGNDIKFYQKDGKRKTSVKLRGGDASRQKTKNSQKEINNATMRYLQGYRDQAIGKLAVLLNKSNINRIRPILKKLIFTHVKKHRKEFESSIEIKTCVYDLFKNFSMTDFVKREWEYRPYYIPASQYTKLQTSLKNPIHIKNYNYSEPIYKLENTIDYAQKKLKRYRPSTETFKNDIKFYLSQDENIVFAKLIKLKYYPTDLVAVKNHNKGKSKEERRFAVYDNYLYNRSLSISMYVLLEGNPKKSMPFIRYDNDPNPHRNLYVGNDKREEVYGKVALSPHFHFQNENDSLICLSKNEGKYRTGRCNAIDCKHLKKYLLDLDAMEQSEVEELLDKNMDYDMPFLHYRAENRKMGSNVDRLFYNFIKDKQEEDINRLEEIALWLTHSKKSKIYHNGKCFDNLIRCLDFLDRISMYMDTSIDCKQRKLYSQLEIVVADNLINAFCNNTSRCLIKDYAPKYIIETDLLQGEEINQP